MHDRDRLPELIEGSGLVLRRHGVSDLEPMARAIAESVEHLRPWMDWVQQEPLTVERRKAMIEEWERNWLAGKDVLLGIFRDGAMIGGAGMHRRIGRGGVEIGYWLHPAFLGQGIATTTSALITESAFTEAAMDRVEIHHDKANARSAAIPARLGFTFIDEHSRELTAPAEVGIGCRWRLERDEWARMVEQGVWKRRLATP